MMLGVTHPFRLIRVLWVLARHGALFPLRAFDAPRWLICFFRLLEAKKDGIAPGKRLADALQSLGPTFIKLGQSLAVRGDLIGDEIADDLSALQDALPAFSSSQAKSTIARELGAELDASERGACDSRAWPARATRRAPTATAAPAPPTVMSATAEAVVPLGHDLQGVCAFACSCPSIVTPSVALMTTEPPPQQLCVCIVFTVESGVVPMGSPSTSVPEASQARRG